jgi:type IV pilus assembly protein PilM
MPSHQMPSPRNANVTLGSMSFRSLLRAPKLGGGASALGSSVSFRRKRTTIVGLDIQPGYVAAARAHVNGSLVLDQAAIAPLDADTVREGEVLNQDALTGALRELFASSGLDRHVRVGIANQRTVMRMLEVPPLSDQSELAAAVRFQAEDQVPMPLATAVTDFRLLGVVDTPQGARQRVLLVAAQREAVERMLAAVRAAGLHAEGVDLSAFALIRSLYRAERDRPPVAQQGEPGAEATARRVLHLNVGGLANMVIAEGTACRFTRVLSRGLEAIAAEIAERRGMPIARARELLRGAGLGAHAAGGPGSGAMSALGMTAARGPARHDAEALAVQLGRERAQPAAQVGQSASEPPGGAEAPIDAQHEVVSLANESPAQPPTPQPAGQAPSGEAAAEPPALRLIGGDAGAPEEAPGASSAGAPAGGGLPVEPRDHSPGVPMSPAADALVGPTGVPGEPRHPGETPADDRPTGETEPGAKTAEELAEVRLVLEAGVRGIAGEVRNSLDFYQAQEGAGQLSLVVLSGPALDIPGFAEMLEQNLGLEVASETVPTINPDALRGLSPQYFAIAAGLAVEEVRE